MPNSIFDSVKLWCGSHEVAEVLVTFRDGMTVSFVEEEDGRLDAQDVTLTPEQQLILSLEEDHEKR